MEVGFWLFFFFLLPHFSGFKGEGDGTLTEGMGENIYMLGE